MNVLAYYNRPLEFISIVWPKTRLYEKQAQIPVSVVENEETYVPAGNMLGKDYITSFILLWFYLTRTPCRIVTTSVKDDHLRVLWGELGQRIEEAQLPLKHSKGGPLIVNHREIKKLPNPKLAPDSICKISYLIGQVSEKGEGMLGHHVADMGDGIPRTLFVADEASGVDDDAYLKADTWARRKLIIGNPYPCTNFFYRGVTGGDLEYDVRDKRKKAEEQDE